MYKVRLVYEYISKYWYFGDLGQFKYNLKMTDKYLVEAKTLFEYKQYLLGYKALESSNFYFSNTLPNLAMAEKSGKDVSRKKIILTSAVQKHIETLEQMDIDTPDNFSWEPEKSLPTVLGIKGLIEEATNVRKNTL